MTFAIPVKSGRGLDSPIDDFLSECQRLLLVVTDGEQFKFSHIVLSRSPGDCESIVTRVQQEQVDAVVLGYDAVFRSVNRAHVGELENAGIDVYVAEQGTAREVLCSILGGSLRDSRGKNLCATDQRRSVPRLGGRN